jgi:YbgC/YbaW family acyl-CoA thioester hydrolase
MTPFHITRRVEFHETDMAGIVHFASFFCYMEFAEVEFLRSRGLTLITRGEPEELGFPRVAATCDYFKPAHFDEVLDIVVTIERLGTKSVTYGFEFARDGEVLARGKVTSVCCRVSPAHRLEPLPIPAWYRERLEGRG